MNAHPLPADAASSASETWFQPFLEHLRALRQHAEPRLRAFFLGAAPLTITRAPGRLDVMGGIADYSGALVLELPLACATYAALQRQQEAHCTLVSLRAEGASFFSVELDALRTGALRTQEALRAYFAGHAEMGWAAYVIGLVHYCLHRSAEPPDNPSGFRLLIWSDVPEGKGVSSSAALEVAAMTAITAHFGCEMTPEVLAAACQWVEQHVVGAPCGIMDQMTCTLGRQERLLRLRCQPATVEGYVAVPDGYQFYGIDSGIRHAVTGADYGTVRTAAFMGYRILAEAAGPSAHAAWQGYLANVTPGAYGRWFADVLPERLGGRDFLDRYDGTDDTATHVDPERTYPVGPATRHPIYEHARVQRFAALLAELPQRDEAALEMGRLMVASHESYGACGLGSKGTDRLVDLVRAAGPGRGLFGAKITGGGSGGTVAAFGTRAAASQVQEIAACYRAETGQGGEVFTGSSPGSAAVGRLTLPLTEIGQGK